MSPETPIQDFPISTREFLKYLRTRTDAMSLSEVLRRQGSDAGEPVAVLLMMHRMDAVKEFVEDLLVEYEQQQAEARTRSEADPGGRFGDSPGVMGVSVRVGNEPS